MEQKVLVNHANLPESQGYFITFEKKSKRSGGPLGNLGVDYILVHR